MRYELITRHVILQIREFISKGSIHECGELLLAIQSNILKHKTGETIQASNRFQSLSCFTTIYGVGPTTARKLYDIGLRAIEDMEQYYDVSTGSTQPAVEDENISTPNGRRVPRITHFPDISVQVALSLRHDLQATIPRTEVEEIYRVVMSELEELQEGCVGTIVGG